jgi:molecular chaperone GrpE
LETLAKHGVERIEALHKPFDPNFHESIASLPNDEHPKDTVIVETQAGFKMHDRVVRPAQVVLAAPAQ